MTSTTHKILATGLLVCVPMGVVWAEDVSAERKYRAALVKAAKAKEAAVEAARAEYLATLKDRLLEETKKGNLDAAVALRTKVNRVESQARAANSIIKRLANTSWVAGGGVAFQWGEDGTFYYGGRERACEPIDGRRVVAVIASGQVVILEFDEGFMKFNQYSTKVSDKPVAIGTRSQK
jgi:hypothetical protein